MVEWERFEALVLRFASAIVADLGIDTTNMRFEAHRHRPGAYGATHDIDVLGTGGSVDVVLECKAYNRPLARKDVYAIRSTYQSMVAAGPERRTALVVVCQGDVAGPAYDHLLDSERAMSVEPSGAIHLVTLPPLFDASALPFVEWRGAEPRRVLVADLGTESRTTEELHHLANAALSFRDRIDAGSALLRRDLSEHDRKITQLNVCDGLLHLGLPTVADALATDVLDRAVSTPRDRMVRYSALVRQSSARFQLLVQRRRAGSGAVGLSEARRLTRVLDDLDPSERFGAELFLSSWHAGVRDGRELGAHYLARARRSLDARSGPEREYGEFLLALRSWEQHAVDLGHVQATIPLLRHGHHAAVAQMLLRRAARGQDVSIFAAFGDDDMPHATVDPDPPRPTRSSARPLPPATS
jgi:hypothetical protein